MRKKKRAVALQPAPLRPLFKPRKIAPGTTRWSGKRLKLLFPEIEFEEDRWYSAEELARVFDCNITTIWRWSKRVDAA